MRRLIRMLCRAAAGLSLVLAPPGQARVGTPVGADTYVRLAHRSTAAPLDSALTAAMFGEPGAVRRLRPLAASASGGGAFEAWDFLCGRSFHDGRYRAAVHDCAAAEAAKPGGGSARTLALARALVATPAPQLAGARGVRLPFDHDGDIPVTLGDVEVAAVADTGAQISVIMASVASRAGVRRMGSASVGSTTGEVAGVVGVLPRLRLGQAVIADLPVLILPDAMLTLDSGKIRMPFILSLYGMALFGRIAWLDHDRVLALGSEAPKVDGGSVRAAWRPNGVGVPFDGPGGRRAAHFDTGANASYLYPAALPLLNPGDTARIARSERRIGGAAGVVTEPVLRLPVARFRVAGQRVMFRNIDVAAEPDTGDAARLGSDLLAKFSTAVLDVRRMRFSLTP